MRDVIQKFKYDDKNVDFAHYISADLNSQKNKSVGVAAVFGEKFGKPTDIINKHLYASNS